MLRRLLFAVRSASAAAATIVAATATAAVSATATAISAAAAATAEYENKDNDPPTPPNPQPFINEISFFIKIYKAEALLRCFILQFMTQRKMCYKKNLQGEFVLCIRI